MRLPFLPYIEQKKPLSLPWLKVKCVFSGCSFPGKMMDTRITLVLEVYSEKHVKDMECKPFEKAEMEFGVLFDRLNSLCSENSYQN